MEEVKPEQAAARMGVRSSQGRILAGRDPRYDPPDAPGSSLSINLRLSLDLDKKEATRAILCRAHNALLDILFKSLDPP